MVGVSRFELPTPRPPDAYSNLAELHPDDSMSVGAGVGGANLINSDGSASYLVSLSFLALYPSYFPEKWLNSGLLIIALNQISIMTLKDRIPDPSHCDSRIKLPSLR